MTRIAPSTINRELKELAEEVEPAQGQKGSVGPLVRRCAVRDHRSRAGDGRRMMGGWGGDGRLGEFVPPAGRPIMGGAGHRYRRHHSARGTAGANINRRQHSPHPAILVSHGW
jgi:hypothetical protein